MLVGTAFNLFQLVQELRSVLLQMIWLVLILFSQEILMKSLRLVSILFLIKLLDAVDKHLVQNSSTLFQNFSKLFKKILQNLLSSLNLWNYL